MSFSKIFNKVSRSTGKRIHIKRILYNGTTWREVSILFLYCWQLERLVVAKRWPNYLGYDFDEETDFRHRPLWHTNHNDSLLVGLRVLFYT